MCYNETNQESEIIHIHKGIQLVLEECRLWLQGELRLKCPKLNCGTCTDMIKGPFGFAPNHALSLFATSLRTKQRFECLISAPVV